jgi:hypothetical protein
LTGCGSGGDLISTVALPSHQTTGGAEGADLPLPPDAGRQSGEPDLTPAQRDYLGALTNAGIHSFNDLRALSIGAYVCQARAAGQSEQTVWDSVAPMVRGDVIEVFPAYEEAKAIRIELFGDEVEAIREIDPLRGKTLRSFDRYAIFPGSHYVTPEPDRQRAGRRRHRQGPWLAARPHVHRQP